MQSNTITQSEFLWTSLFALGNVFFFSTSIFTRVESMRHIDTVIFFPLYETFGPIMVTCVSLFFFKEVLSLKEVLGIVAGITVPLLLITKTENRIQKNLLLGVILVVATAILTTISTASAKQVLVMSFSLELFVFMTFVFGVFFMFLQYYFHSRHSHKKYISK